MTKLNLYRNLVESQSKVIELQNEAIASLKKELDNKKRYAERLLKEEIDIHNENAELQLQIKKLQKRGEI